MKRTDRSRCSIPGCGRVAERGRNHLCAAHYGRLRRTGDVRAEDPVTQPMTVLERFKSHVEISPTTGCWEWRAHRNANGYGTFGYKSPLERRSRPHHAHRVAWWLFRGDIPAGMQVDHLCRNRGCVNPDHLEPVSPKVNTARSFAPGTQTPRSERTHCRRGHEFSGSNLGIRPGGYRKCLACMREFQRAYLARKVAS